MLKKVMGSPKGHPNVKPFLDHVFSFMVVDGRIWFRNYQIVYNANKEDNSVKEADKVPVLVEIGPRFVLNPVRIFAGSFGGATLWSNSNYISPNQTRGLLKRKKSQNYGDRQEEKAKRAKHVANNPLVEDEIEEVFRV